MPDRREITVTINGEKYTREVETRLTLADFIRHECYPDFVEPLHPIGLRLP